MSYLIPRNDFVSLYAPMLVYDMNPIFLLPIFDFTYPIYNASNYSEPQEQNTKQEIIPLNPSYFANLSNNTRSAIPAVYSSDLSRMDIEDVFKTLGITTVNGKTIRFGSRERRPDNASYGVKNSHHKEIDPITGYANARDISIAGGTSKDYNDFKNLILRNPRLMSYLQNKGWGIINEVTPAHLNKTNGTGYHFHFGPDRLARRILNYWIQNPNTYVTQMV